MVKPNKQKIGAKASQNIAAAGGALALFIGLGLSLAVLSTALAFAYLAKVELPEQEARQIRHIAQAYAVQEASSLHNLLSRLHFRIASAALSPRALQSIADSSDMDLRVAEKAMMNAFPEALSLRLLPLDSMGTANLREGKHGLRNHIEIDLVRRAGKGEKTAPESFQFDGRWLTSLAQVINHPHLQDRQAVIIVSFDNAEFSKQLGLVEPHGKSVLQQLYTSHSGSQSSQDIATSGQASSRGEAYQAFATLPDTHWRIAFTPSDSLMDSLRINRKAFYSMAAVTIAGVILGLLSTALLLQGRLRKESKLLLATAESRRPLSLTLAELAPLGRQLRRLTKNTHVISETKPTQKASSSRDSSEPSSLLYQKIDFIDEAQADDEAHKTRSNHADGAEFAFSEHVFRAYDIRGNADSELSDRLVQGIGRAVGELALEHGEQQFIVGYDGRLSSPRIRDGISKGLLEAGLDVIDIGLIPTPVMYFATQHLSCHSGIMITGSHNPASDNGMKIVLQRETLAAGAIQDIRRRISAAASTKPLSKNGQTGRIIKQDLRPAYIERIVSDIAIAVPLKIVIDAGNGATSELAPRLFQELGCEVIPLFCEIDGHFPNHPPDSSNEDNLHSLVAVVQAENADLGVAFDGDGDRVALVTRTGRIVRADSLLMLLAQDVVSRNPGADVVFDVKCSRHLAELITEHGGRPIMWKTGHALMKQKISETGALLGGEFSGHIFFGERWFGHDDGMYAAARLAEILSTQDQSLDEALDALPSSVSTPEILLPVPEEKKFALMQNFAREAHFEDGKTSTIDGIRVDFSSGWGLLRASNTSAALTARFEADSHEQLLAIQQVFREQIAKLAPDLQLPF